MFGLTEFEMEMYRNNTQDFAVREVTPRIVSNAKIMTPVLMQGDKMVPDRGYVNQLVTDLETIITLTATNMSYEYAYLQCESELSESEIIAHLHEKYESYVLMQMVKYGVAFTTDFLTEVVSEIVLELPYLYISVVEDEDFDDELFLEERLEAYNEYLDSNFAEDEDEEDEEDIDE
ncbi:hypothetical protein P59_057 [Bacillus phage P59]|nr:hypothetical protein P59_057 [Bacillus phage P59]